VDLERARRAEQLDLEPVERDGDLALGRELLDQPVAELLRPRRRVEVGVAEAVGDRPDAVDLVARGPVERGFEDVALGREVPGRGGERDLRLGGHAPVGEGRDALAGDDADRRGDDRVAGALRGLSALAGHGHDGPR
jgi:hypothetical protein